MTDSQTIADGLGGNLKLVAELGEQAAECELVPLVTDGLAEGGLPPIVPVIWNKRAGQVVEVRDALERFRLAPERRTGTATALTLASFIELVNRHKDKDSAVFADTDWQKPRFEAVIDYHQSDGGARWLGHRIAYRFPLTEEWQAWLAHNGEVMEQEDFAGFIEERIAELSAPDQADINDYETKFATKLGTPAEIITLSRGLQVNVGATVKTAKTLQSGEAEILFHEEHRDAAGDKLVVPGLFMLAVPVFFRGSRVRIPVRLRYRAQGGRVRWFYQLYRPDVWITDAIANDLARVAEAVALPVYEGAPEAGG